MNKWLLKMGVKLLALLILMTVWAGCAKKAEVSAPEAKNQEPTTIMVAAAASLKNSYDEHLIPLFEKKYPWIKVNGTYDSSGKLQVQIEEGLNADVFMSAALKQMNALKEKKLVDQETIVNLLENKIVLIVPANSPSSLNNFTDITKANMIAVGDPESVPAGQYAKEALSKLGIWPEVQAKASLGTNVTEVLNWVAEGSADAGIVYATDAAANKNVKVIAEAPPDSLSSQVIYPAAIIAKSTKKEAAQLFLDFLKSEEAMAEFKKAGFSPSQN